MIHMKINLSDHFTVLGLAEREIGLGHKIGISQDWREHCTGLETSSGDALFIS